MSLADRDRVGHAMEEQRLQQREESIRDWVLSVSGLTLLQLGAQT
jgi:hypothetical protein